MIRSGLIGRSILSSRSPWLHEQEAKAQGLELSYELFDFNQRALADTALPTFLKGLAADGYAGVNITYPFKQIVIPVLDFLSPSATLVGAVNTVEMREGVLTGHNTDMEGFRESVRAGLGDLGGQTVLLMGAGGAGAAVASVLLACGAAIVRIADENGERATALAQRLSDLFGDGRAVASDMGRLSTADIHGIVNATPMGMAAHPGLPLDPDLIEARHWVADIVYFPLETELLRVARQKGCHTLDGSGMVIAQAARAFAIITGHAANIDRMRQSFLQA